MPRKRGVRDDSRNWVCLGFQPEKRNENQVKAKRAYGDFLTLWKDADSDIPILVQAKAEYARLP
jgi:hypothetical protein